jgi:XTP/dITP diphosphohydrolase
MESIESKITTIVIASGNNHKLKEIGQIIGDIGVRWFSGSDFAIGNVDETGMSYAQNAEIKARAYSLASGLPALADDSGLEVDALDGLPGVHSNRLFGENKTDAEKVSELLKRLKGVQDPHRSARFRCHAVLMMDDKILASVSGCVEGRIMHHPEGTGGFGYDPVFMYPRRGISFARLSADEKNAISHRGKAMRKIREFLLRYTG